MNDLIYCFIIALFFVLVLLIWHRLVNLYKVYNKQLDIIKEYKKSQITLTQMIDELVDSNIELLTRLSEQEKNPNIKKSCIDNIIKFKQVKEVFIDRWLNK